MHDQRTIHGDRSSSLPAEIAMIGNNSSHHFVLANRNPTSQWSPIDARGPVTNFPNSDFLIDSKSLPSRYGLSRMEHSSGPNAPIPTDYWACGNLKTRMLQ